MKLASLDELQVLKNNSVDYKGNMPEYQRSAKFKQKQLRLTKYQNLLFKRALYGLTVYEKKELQKMCKQKKNRIRRIHKKAQGSINIMKQESVNRMCSNLVDMKFGHKKPTLVAFLQSDVGTDPKIINTLELKNLGITKTHIIDRFINEGILPRDFYELKKAV